MQEEKNIQLETTAPENTQQDRQVGDDRWRELNAERIRSTISNVRATQELLSKARIVRRETLKKTISI